MENTFLMPWQSRDRKMQEAIQRDDHDISGPLSSLGWYQNGEWLMVRTAADRNAGQLHTDLTEPGMLTLWQHPRKTRRFRVALPGEAVRALRAAGRQHTLNDCANASENNDYTLWFSVSELSICRGSVVFTCAADTVGISEKDKAVRQTPARRFTTSSTLVPHRL